MECQSKKEKEKIKKDMKFVKCEIYNVSLTQMKL